MDHLFAAVSCRVAEKNAISSRFRRAGNNWVRYKSGAPLLVIGSGGKLGVNLRGTLCTQKSKANEDVMRQNLFLLYPNAGVIFLIRQLKLNRIDIFSFMFH